jgi:hypothetical protein
MKMLQQQRPHIILRFSRTVVEEPPQQHTPTTRGTPDTDETLTDDEEERRGKRRRNDVSFSWVLNPDLMRLMRLIRRCYRGGV